MFNNSEDEDKLCQILKAYCEEFDKETVTIILPKVWEEQHKNTYMGGCKLIFSAESSITIMGANDYNYTVQLAHC